MATRRSPAVLAAVVALVLSGCSLVADPSPPPVRDASLAPTGPVGYVVCPAAVSPVELDTATPEAAITLPLPSPAPQGNFAIATSPDGRWAYVVTTFGAPPAATPSVSAGVSSSTTAGGAGHVRQQRGHPHRPGQPAGGTAHPTSRAGWHPCHRRPARRADPAGRRRYGHRRGGRRLPEGRRAARPRRRSHRVRDGPRP